VLNLGLSYGAITSMYTLPYGVKLPCLGYEFAKIQTDNYDCYSCHGYFDYQWRQVQYWTFLDP